MIYDYAIVGGGIVGLATALAIGERKPGAALLLIEKEPAWASHQTGRNSGVIHSGVYYRPGSLRARMAVAGNRSMAAFCREHSIAHRICGKLIVATSDQEINRLRDLQSRAASHGIVAEWVDREGAGRLEPHVRAAAALHIPSTGVVSFRAVAEKMVELLTGKADLRASCRLLHLREEAEHAVLDTSADSFRAKVMINCGGLFSDRIARAAGERPDVRIVPFRGEYYDVGGESASLVKALIYPVPNPALPFLGVHLTRGIDSHVHAGPNAVLALRREGYKRTDFSLRDTIDTLTFGGFWRMVVRYGDEGVREMIRSISRRRFARSVQELVPDIQERDLSPAPAGVRAQALTPSGDLADDFVILRARRAIHVCNAPSPAATAALEIGKYIAEQC